MARERGSRLAGGASPPRLDLRVHDLGRMAYAQALALQRRLQQEVTASRIGDEPATLAHLILVEHDPPVITISRRPGARRHLIASPRQLAAAGVEVVETDRGGDITYHGPGQLVVYPILDLNALGLRLIGYLRFLEEIVIGVLARFGIEGVRDDAATGVWVRPSQEAPHDNAALGAASSCGPPDCSKICAIGVRVSRWVTMHGLALNVTTDLDHFNLIVPCGLAGRSVTSMQHQLRSGGPAINEVKSAMVDEFHAMVAIQIPKFKIQN